MSIYATLWILKFPSEGDFHADCDWIEVIAQGVPPHIGTPSTGHGYEKGDPYSEFLPPPVPVDSMGQAEFMRAVVFVTYKTLKGTVRSPQEYVGPLLVLSGREYAQLSFKELHSRICDRLRGNLDPVIGEVKLPDGRIRIIRGKTEPGQK